MGAGSTLLEPTSEIRYLLYVATPWAGVAWPVMTWPVMTWISLESLG